MAHPHRQGIAFMILGVASFSLMDATMKQLVTHYPPMQVSFMRNVVSLPLVLMMAMMMGEWRDLKPVHGTLHIVRGFVGVAVLWTFIYSIGQLSLADAYSIFLSAPLFVTAFSMPILKEHVGWHRWLAIAAGIIGVLLILRPTGEGIVTLGGVAALASAVCYAVSVNLIRLASRTDTAQATILWQLITTAALSGVLAISGWARIDLHDGPWLLALGVTGTLGQYFLTQAFRRAPSAVVAPFEYTALLWGVLLDWFLWSTSPDSHIVFGAAIVVASGLYVIYREGRVRLT